MQDLQGQYFASEGQNFDTAGPLNETVTGAVPEIVGHLIEQTKGGRTGLSSCSYFDVGSSRLPGILVQVLDKIAPDHCDSFIYETTSSDVAVLEQERSDRAGIRGHRELKSYRARNEKRKSEAW